MNINAYQIEYHISQNELKEYAAFCYFKYLYRNGCIYNYTSTKLAYKSNYSASFVRKSVSLFLAKGWCRMHGKNLIFNKSSSFNGTESKIKLYDEIKHKKLSIKELLDLFKLQIFVIHNSKLNRLKKVKRDLKSNKTRIRHRAENYADSIGKKTEQQRSKLPNESDKLKLSNGKLSRIFNCSAGTASNLIKRLAYKGLIEIHRKSSAIKFNGVIPKHGHSIAKDLGYSYGYSNYLFIVETLEFVIC